MTLYEWTLTPRTGYVQYILNIEGELIGCAYYDSNIINACDIDPDNWNIVEFE